MPNLAAVRTRARRRREGQVQGPGIQASSRRGGRGGGSLGIALRLLAGAGCLLAASGLHAGSIVGSKHDLSSNRTPDSMQVCIFCHTPHSANNTLGSSNAPLWNRFVDPTKNYLVFTSPSMVSTPGKPSTTISAVCLGCHDGTMGSATVYATTANDKMALINAPGLHETNVEENCTACHDSLYGPVTRADLKFGLDLTNMHPIAVPYPSATQSAQFHQPPDAMKGWSDVRLFNGRVECPSCHQPHDPAIVPFLAKSNAGSALCLTCHIH